MNVKDNEIKDLMSAYKKMVINGLSPDAKKPSQTVPLFMKSKGYDVVGIYPAQKLISGISIYGNLAEVPPEYRKFVDVFRRPEHIPQVVDEVIAVGGVEVLWLQLGITHIDAEKKAELAGIRVVSNRCLAIEYKKYF